MKKFLKLAKLHGLILRPQSDFDQKYVEIYVDCFWYWLSPSHIFNTQPWCIKTKDSVLY